VNVIIANRRYRAVRAAQFDRKQAAVPAARAAALIEREFLRPKDLSTLTNLWHAIAGARGTSPARLRLIREAFQTGAWLLLPPSAAAPALPVSLDAEPVTEQIRTAREVKTWIEMELVDNAGRPMSGREYLCMLPNGSIERGTLDARGRVRFDNIDPGTCAFSILDLDQETWTPLNS
jgi:hypothetical protein